MAESITLQTSDSNVQQSDTLGRLSFAASNEANTADARLIGASIRAEAEGDFTEISNRTSIIFSTASSESATDKLKINSSGHFVPINNKTYDIGSSSLKFRNIYSESNYTDKVVLTSGSAASPTTDTLYNLSGILHYENKAIALLPSGGTQNQILQKASDLSYDLEWIDNYATEISVYVKNTTGSNLTKGQAVYISGAQGDHPVINLALASGESTSSKTLGLLKQDLADNEFGYVISEGLLEGINTSAANLAGDTIWLSPITPGSILYGLSNKPSAPYHMVFIGYVIRKQSNNGSIYVKVQNGFEIQELHNVSISGVADNQFLRYESSSDLWKNSSLTSSYITDFNTSISGLLPVKDIVAGSNITVSSVSGTYTINSTGGGGGGSTSLYSYTAVSGFPASGLSSAIYLSTDNGRMYQWNTSAYSEIGPIGGIDTSLWSLFTPPAPTGLLATAGNQQISLSWSAPTVLSQTPITDYIVQFSSNSGTTWSTFNDGISTATSATITSLTNGTPYIFRVAGVNAVGSGNFSSSSNSATPTNTVSVTYLLVGGGGGGGSARGAGGGAGGYIYDSGNAALSTTLSVVVGSGGTGGIYSGAAATVGGSTSFPLITGTLTAIGGGRGAEGLYGLSYGIGQAGGTGGSGGGGSGYTPVGAGGDATSGQGNAGGAGYSGGEPYNGGGGGGAGAVGGTGAAAAGGNGKSSESSFLTAASAGVDISGTRWIAGGGAAGTYNYGASNGGNGGGGAGGNNVAGTAGIANTGGGGGGGGNMANGAAGGAGIAIIRVADSITASSTTGSPTVIVTGGFRYYKFTSDGSITF